MRRLFSDLCFIAVGLLALVLFATSPHAQFNSFPPGVFTGQNALYPSTGGGCSQATTYLARVSYGGTDTTNYTNLICGLVADGVWSKLDVFYIFAAPDSTSALFNLVSASYTGISHGTVTFAANVGETGDASTGYIDSVFVPSTGGGNYTINSAHLGFCSTGANWITGGYDGAAQTWFTAGSASVNDSTSLTPSGGAGFHLVTRTAASGANSTVNYKNGVSFATDTTASIQNLAQSIYIFARNLIGTPSTFVNAGSTVTMMTIGGGLSSGDAANFQTRINTFMTAYGISTC